MVVQRASKAEVVSALAVHRGHDLGEILALYRTFHGVFAIGRGAPLEVFFIVDVGSRKECVVSANVSVCQISRTLCTYLS